MAWLEHLSGKRYGDDWPLVVAVSGGKDSTALALALSEKGERFKMIHTATGNELPGVRKHIDRIAEKTGAELIDLEAPTLGDLIERWNALPNWRQRWCTRVIKIEPCAKWLAENDDTLLAVGLRADEPGRVGGVYAPSVDVVYPLRDWGWSENDVIWFCESRGFTPPGRTDCAVCFYQTLYEWWSLWRNHPDEYAQGERWEQEVGHTFRSPGRDTQPAALADLRVEFENGYKPKERRRSTMCRVCSM